MSYYLITKGEMKMNNVSLLGRLTKDVELRYSQSGTAVANFTLAVNRQFKNQNGEREADFIRTLAFGKTAEIIAQYVKKGQQLAVEGRIQTGSYENNEGKTVFTTDVVVNQFTFISDGNRSENNSQQNNQPSNQTFEKQGNPIDIPDDGLPF